MTGDIGVGRRVGKIFKNKLGKKLVKTIIGKQKENGEKRGGSNGEHF